MGKQCLVTESVNPNTVHIDQWSNNEILQFMNRENEQLIKAVQNVIPEIEKVVDVVIKAIKNKGHVFFIGAGTSGRLGVLEAVECPPTFGVSSDMFQAIIAGGEKAIFSSVESAEDDKEQGIKDLQARHVTENDVVIGIAASGSTPFVIGALTYANKINAVTVAITCNTNSAIGEIADYKIEAEPGAEVISGSTRMKAGSTQKIILNMITTTSMIKLGKVYRNFMVNLKVSNNKLRSRAINIIKMATGVDDKSAEKMLDASQNNVKIAIVMIKNNVNYETALEQLALVDGYVYKVIDEEDRNQGI